jgi:DNA-binding transcriptional ArsR family regulator
MGDEDQGAEVAAEVCDPGRRARCVRVAVGTQPTGIRKLKSILLIVDRQPAPALLPILRSQQQGEILALLLGDPDLELSLTEIAARTGAPHPSVYREVQRAEQAGLVTTRKVGNTRLVRANTGSPYYAGLADVLTRAFGVPAVLAEVLRDVNGITAAYIYGSWAARHEGLTGQRPVGDIDVLILGDPDRDQLYAALSTVEQRLGRPVQATIRDRTWLESGSGSFHDTVTSRPLLGLSLSSLGAKLGANDHRQRATPGHVQPLSPQLNGTPGHAGPPQAMLRECLLSSRSRVRVAVGRRSQA